MESLINIGIIVTYLMVGFATIATLAFGVKKMIQNNKDANKTLYTIGGLLIPKLLILFFKSVKRFSSSIAITSGLC